MSDVLDDLNTQLSGYIQDVESIKEKIKQVAQGKNITIVENVDTPISVLNKINNGTVPTPTGTLNITQNNTYDVSLYQYANVNVQGGGGTTKYLHRISAKDGDSSSDVNFVWAHDVISLSIITDSSAPMTYNDLINWLADNGYIYNPNNPSQSVLYTEVTGVMVNQSMPGFLGFYSGICAQIEYGNLVIGFLDTGTEVGFPGNFTDTVEQIN